MISDPYLDCLQQIAYDFEDKKIDRETAKTKLLALTGNRLNVDEWLDLLEAE